MKNWIFKSGLTFSLFAATFLTHAAAAEMPGNTSGIGPKIQFDSTKYDFGRALAGTQVKHDFVFTNEGDATLQITKVTPGCGCTTFGEWTHEVEPGKTGVIPIQVNISTLYNGPVTKMPSITCNDKSQPLVRFQIHGTVYKMLDVNPAYVSLSIEPDAVGVASATVHIVNNDAQPLTLQKPTSNVGTFKGELKTNVPGKDYELIVETTGSLPTGNSPALITVGTSSKITPVINVPVVAIVKPLMDITPPTLTVPAGPITNGESVSVFLRNKGTHPVTLSEPSVNASGVNTAISISTPGQVFAVTATFPDGFELPAGKDVNVTVKTDNPRFPVVEIPIRQVAVPANPAAPAAPRNVRVSSN